MIDLNVCDVWKNDEVWQIVKKMKGGWSMEIVSQLLMKLGKKKFEI